MYAINVIIEEPEILLLYVVINSYPSTFAVTNSGLSEIAVIVNVLLLFVSKNVFDKLNVLLVSSMLITTGFCIIFTTGGDGTEIKTVLENL